MFEAAGFPVFAVFKDELATRKSLKAFFLPAMNKRRLLIAAVFHFVRPVEKDS